MFRVIVLTCVLLSLAITGCALPLPADTPEPYHDQKLQKILVGKSTSEWVISIFGQPDAQLDVGKVWLYGETRMVTIDGLNHDYQSLLVVLENNVVEYYEVLESKYGCWSNGLCLVSGWVDLPIDKNPVKLDREKTAVISLREDDTKAKNFAPNDEQCGVYIYKEEKAFIGKDFAPAVSMGPVRDEPLHYKGYMFQMIAAGDYSLVAHDQTIDFTCEGGSLMYFEVKHSVGWNDAEISIHRSEKQEGRAAIMQRHLLITW